MQADGFLQQKRRHPFALGVALTINLAAVGALMVAKGPSVLLPPEAIELIDITPVAPPPEPIETPPKPRDTPVIKETVTLPTPEVPTTSQDSDFTLPPPTPGPATGNPGTGEGIALPPAPAPIPVLTEAALDTRFADQFQPPYPPGKQRLGEEGRAVLRVLIGADGRVKKVERVSGDDAFLSVSERQALRRWRFKPATRDGLAVEAWKMITVRFEIS